MLAAGWHVLARHQAKPLRQREAVRARGFQIGREGIVQGCGVTKLGMLKDVPSPRIRVAVMSVSVLERSFRRWPRANAFLASWHLPARASASAAIAGCRARGHTPGG